MGIAATIRAVTRSLQRVRGALVLLASVATLSQCMSSATAQPLPLWPATLVDVTGRSGLATGSVSSGHAVYTFNIWESSVVSIGVDVTQILSGGTYVDDDTQVFLFNATGQLLAFNDDVDPFESGFESLIEGLAVVPGDYYVAVTTFGNDPLLGLNNVIVGWEDDGGSNVAFDLIVGLQTLFLNGDYDGSGLVDGADLLAWKQQYGSAVEVYSGADGNGDGAVNAADYTVWRDNLGAGIGLSLPATSAVPVSEPVSATLLLAAVACGVRMGRPR